MTFTEIRELHFIAREFRRGLIGKKIGKAMCAVVSMALQGYLEFCGYKCEMTEGDVGEWNHFWITFPDGTILDATADQFGLPRIYIGDKPENYIIKKPTVVNPDSDKIKLKLKMAKMRLEKNRENRRQLTDEIPS